MSLCAWLRRKAADRRAFRFVLGLGLLASALATPWLADRNRLIPPGEAPGISGRIEPAG